MKSLAFAIAIMAATLAGCVDEPGESDPNPEANGEVASTNPDTLQASLDVSPVRGVDLVWANVSYGVVTTLEEVNWTLVLHTDNRSSAIHMGQGGLDSLPGKRAINLTEGSHEFTLTITGGGEESIATARVSVTSTVTDPNECQRAEGYSTIVVQGQGFHLAGDNSELWRETNGLPGVQTPDSCPPGPHDERLR